MKKITVNGSEKQKKATAKLPTKADLSNCHLEFLPETVFINEELEILNLRHNVLKERPIEEDIYTIGWLDDLPRFTHLRSLNLADNNLRCFPMAVCKMRTLTELNLASNKIEDIPPDIVDIECLQMLHLHNNHLDYLPDEMCRMRNLLVLVLAFNHFTTVPSVLLQSAESLLRIDSLIMAGNRIEKLSQEVLSKTKHIKKIDFRMNKLHLSPSEMAKFPLLENVTHLDVRDNSITDLDVRALRQLEYLNCDRNKIHSLQVSGSAIKTLFAVQNEITSFAISPKPEWLGTFDISHNKLETLPSWISDCFFLVQLTASHNLLKQLPEKLLSGTPKLKVLNMSHNLLTELPELIQHTVLESVSLEHNQLKQLPSDLFINLPKLRYICLTNNQLETIPDPNPNVYQNKLSELYLSANRLGDSVIQKVTLFHKLKVLHVAYNQITEIHDRDLRTLENLQELNISGNYLRHLPKCLGRHSKLQALRANANLLKELPDFRYSTNLKVLEVGSNRLMDVSVTNLMASNVNLLDISGNPEMQVSSLELRGIKTKKKVCMVDIKGQNRSLLDLRTAGFEDLEIPWQSGLSQTSGMRNKLSVSIVNRPKFNEGQEGLFALFDGGRNDEVTRILSNRITGVMEEELKHSSTGHEYLKYTMLAAHRKLKFTGQKVGAAGAICHICKPAESNNYMLNVANVGDVEVVVCRRGEAVVLTQLFTVSTNKTEMERICKSGGIVTEDNKINGVTQNTRLLGSSYLFPFVIPDPHVTSTTLQPDDQLVIIANQGLWKYMSYQETVNEIINIPDPVLAAKKLQDLAQGYNSQENIGVLVVRLMLSPEEKNKMREMFHRQFEIEQNLLAELRVRDIEREEKRKRAELEEHNESVPMDIVKLKHAKKRKQIDAVFGENGMPDDYGTEDIDDLDGVRIKPLPRKHHNSDSNDPTSNWEMMLQKRLTEEVKDKELIHAMRRQGEYDPYFPTIEADDNWSTTTKLKGQVKERTVTLPPNEYKQVDPVPPAPHTRGFTDDSQISTESLYFKRELKHPLNVDRDAILFHNMQLSRQKTHHLSSRSIDSIQSDPAYASAKEMAKEKKSSSHSIEVLLHGPTAHHVKSFGGSHNLQKREVEVSPRNSKGDSCPSEMTDRLKMLEEKGFLPHETDNKNVPKYDKRMTAEQAESQYADRLDLSGGESTDTLGEQQGEIEASTDTLTDATLTTNGAVDQFQDLENAGYETISGVQFNLRKGDSKPVNTDTANNSDNVNANMMGTEVPKVGYLQWLNNTNGKKSNSAEMLPEKTVDEAENITELYATVRKVRKVHNQNVQNGDSDITLETENKVIDNETGNKNNVHAAVIDADRPIVRNIAINGDIHEEKEILINYANNSNSLKTDYSSISPVNSFNPSKSQMNKAEAINLGKSPVHVTEQSVNQNIMKVEADVSATNTGSSFTQSAQHPNEPEISKSPEPKFKKRPAPKVDESKRSKSPVSYYQGKSNFVQQQSQKFIQDQVQVVRSRTKDEPIRSRSPVIYGNGVVYKTNEDIPIHNKVMNNSQNTTVPVGLSLSAVKNQRSRSKSPVSFRGKNQLPDVVKNTGPRTSPSPRQLSPSVMNHTSDVGNVSAERKKPARPPVPPRIPLNQVPPQSDINSNSLKSLEDLIAYNRQQQQKVSYKLTPKVAPTPPPKVPETSMITKTASQRSVIITYL